MQRTLSSSARAPIYNQHSEPAQDLSCAAKTQIVALAIIASIGSFFFLPAPLPGVVCFISLAAIVYAFTRSSKVEEPEQRSITPPQPTHSYSGPGFNFTPTKSTGSDYLSRSKSPDTYSLSSSWLPTDDFREGNEGRDSFQLRKGKKRNPYESVSDYSLPRSHGKVGSSPERSSSPPALLLPGPGAKKSPHDPIPTFHQPFFESPSYVPLDDHRHVGPSSASSSSSVSSSVLPADEAKISPYETVSAPTPPAPLPPPPRLKRDPVPAALKSPVSNDRRQVGSSASSSSSSISSSAVPAVGAKTNPYQTVSASKPSATPTPPVFLPTQATQRVRVAPKGSLAATSKTQASIGTKANPHEKASSLSQNGSASTNPVPLPSRIPSSGEHRAVGGNPKPSQPTNSSQSSRRTVGSGN